MVGIHELIKRLNSRQSNKQSGEVTKELNYDGMQTTPLTLGDGNWNADDIKMWSTHSLGYIASGIILWSIFDV